MNTRPVFFDEFSLLNRYRAGYATGDKVRGFFHLLRFRAASDAAEPYREIASGPQAPVNEFALSAACVARPIILQFKSQGRDLVCLENDQAEAKVIPTEGSDDEFLVLISGLRCADVDCRVLLMSAATLNRLHESVPEEVLRDLRRDEDVALLKTILRDQVLGRSEPLMRRLAAVADIDAEVDDRGWIKARVAIPKDSPKLGPDCRVVIVIDCPRDEPA